MVLDPQGYPLQQYTNLADTVVWELLSTGTIVLINGCTISMGNGSPEGVVTATPGSWYIQTDGVAPNFWYQKQTGVGNTGWVAVGSGAVANPGAPSTSVQFNNGGAFGGNAGFIWDDADSWLGLADAGNIANAGPGLINGVTIAADLQEATPDIAQGASAFDVVSTRTEFETETDFFVGQSFGLQVIPAGDYVEPFGPIYTGLMVGLLIPSTSTHKLSDAYALSVSCNNAGTGAMNDELAAIRSAVAHNSAAHINGLIAGDFDTRTSAGLVDQSYGLRAISDATAGTVTQNYGIRIDGGGGGGGTFTHNYGLWIADQTLGGGANPDPWAIWTDGGKHYFKGNVLSSGIIGLGATSTPDGGFSRISAGVWAFGNGTAASVTGTLRLAHLRASALQIFANNAAAITGGLAAGDFYRTGADPDVVCVVH